MTSGTGYPGGTGSPGGSPPGADPFRRAAGATRPDDDPARSVSGDRSDEEDSGPAPVAGDDPVAVLRRERDEYLDMVRRVQADFENYKKRVVRQQTDHLERAASDIVTKMLPVLDAFDLARAHLDAGHDVSDEGKALLAASSLLSDTLTREGLERIDDAGVSFDPTIHEAVEHVPAGESAATEPVEPGRAPGAGGDADDGVPGADAGPVVDGVLRAGYRFKGRVVRPAMVRVRG